MARWLIAFIVVAWLVSCAPRPQPFDVERLVNSPGWHPVEVD